MYSKFADKLNVWGAAPHTHYGYVPAKNAKNQKHNAVIIGI